MNREILFRGKAPITEEWLYGDLITLEREDLALEEKMIV